MRWLAGQGILSGPTLGSVCHACPVDDADEAERIKASVMSMLPPAKIAWNVIVSKNPHTGGWAVQLDHEASHGLGFDMGESRGNADETISRLADWLTHRKAELDRIAVAPALSNADSVMEIRTLASIFNWSKSEVRAVVRFVERWTLTEDEAEWLISTIGHDGPTPERSRNF